MEENEKVEETTKKTTVKKGSVAKIETKSGGKYSYQYTDLAQIHSYLEENNMSYYQYVDRINEDDYIMTVPIIDGVEKAPRRGVRVVQPNPNDTNNNVYQVQGIATTYERRYSLLMAFGLATEDNDANDIAPTEVKPLATTKEEALEFVFNFGKHKGKKVSEVPKNYLEWLLEYGQEDMKQLVSLVIEPTTKEDVSLIGEFMDKMTRSGIDLEKVLSGYKVDKVSQLTKEQMKKCITRFEMMIIENETMKEGI